MESCSRVFQISGIKNQETKKTLTVGIQQLGGKYIGGSVYEESITHLIIPQVLSSEKFFAACAAGKWVVTPDYVLDSVRSGSWLPEDRYEVTINTDAPQTFCPARAWRNRVSRGELTGAFQGWRVLLVVQEPARRAMFKRVLTAGKARVFDSVPPSLSSLTHVVVKPVTESSGSFSAPRYSVTHLVQHLFGRNCVDMNLSLDEDLQTEMMKDGDEDPDLCDLETQLREYVLQQQRHPRLNFLEFLGYHDPFYCPPSTQATDADFSSVSIMMECGLFAEALDWVRSAGRPGLMPPALCLAALLEYALQETTPWFFQRSFLQVLYNLLLTNPPWSVPSRTKRYFSLVLQCPQCRGGLWPFLQSTVSSCLSTGGATCHPLPAPPSPTLRRFHGDLLAFVLRLFQAELHSLTGGDFPLQQQQGTPLPPAVAALSASASLLYATFWTVWECSTLLSLAVKQLLQLLVQAAAEEFTEKKEEPSFPLADRLLDLLCVLVEFWCQHNFKLNQNLVEKALKDLAEHFALISRDVGLEVSVELVVRVSSSRLKVAMADAVFRSLCCRSGLTLGDQPLSLRKMVLSYLPALGTIARSPVGIGIGVGVGIGGPGSGGAPRSGVSPEPERRSSLVKNTSLEKEKVPRGLYKVNAAGETLLHRVCKRNQVETVLQILALPGIDANIKDHAGWTPLQEACHHGSTACVRALLPRLTAPMLLHQVGGVCPLLDAVLNRHWDIAKLLLSTEAFALFALVVSNRQAEPLAAKAREGNPDPGTATKPGFGSSLLRQTDGGGRTPLDVVADAAQRAELLCSAEVGDSSLKASTSDLCNRPLLEGGAALLAHLLVSYLRESGPPPPEKTPGLGHTLAAALRTRPGGALTSGWTDPRVVRLTEDVQTLLELSRGQHRHHVPPALGVCDGENSRLLLDVLELLRSRGDALGRPHHMNQQI